MENIDEIKKLNEELEIRDNAVEHFRKEAIRWAHITNEYQKDKIKLEQTLQEIKAIAKDNIIGCFSDKCDLANEILQKITKAEEE